MWGRCLTLNKQISFLLEFCGIVFVFQETDVTLLTSNSQALTLSIYAILWLHNQQADL